MVTSSSSTSTFSSASHALRMPASAGGAVLQSESEMPALAAHGLPASIAYTRTKSACGMRLGYAMREIRMASSTPAQRSWCAVCASSNVLGSDLTFGLMQRT